VLLVFCYFQFTLIVIANATKGLHFPVVLVQLCYCLVFVYFFLILVELGYPVLLAMSRGSNITECDLNMVVEKTQYRFGFLLP